MNPSPIGWTEMTDEEFNLFSELIYDACGILFPPSMKFFLERRLRQRPAALGLHSFRDYYRLVRYGPEGKAETDEILDRVTNNETYFFRGSSQLRAFQQEILPALAQAKAPGAPIRIWSAGCSSGEEPYSLSMLARDGGKVDPRRLQILGHDISRRVLTTAAKGEYRPASLRETSETMRRRYFTSTASGYRLDEDIVASVQFGRLNLMDESSMTGIRDMDVVFCRNVMIYFSHESRARLLSTLRRRMIAGGYLIVGHADNIMEITTEFELCPLQNDVVYRVPEGS